MCVRFEVSPSCKYFIVSVFFVFSLVLEEFYVVVLTKVQEILDFFFFFRCERRTAERLSDSRPELVDLFV